MKRRYISSLAIALAVSGGSWQIAAAQDRTSNGNTTGSAVPRGDGGGGTATSSGGSSSSGSGSSGSGSSSGSSMGSGSVSMPSTWSTFEAPRRADEQRSRSGSGGSSTGDRAVSRDGGSAPRGSSGTAAASGSGSGEPRRAVPTYSRPRDGRPVTGTAVERGTAQPPSGGYPIYPYYPSYPWGFWGSGYGYGLGYLFYDPWGYYGGYGFGDPYGYGYGGYGGYSGGGSGGYAVSRSYKDSGNLRLKIDQKQAQIYVDGYYVGVVDSFDGAFQKLSLDSGEHKVELKAEGFEPLQFEVLITPGETVTYKGGLKPVK